MGAKINLPEHIDLVAERSKPLDASDVFVEVTGRQSLNCVERKWQGFERSYVILVEKMEWTQTLSSVTRTKSREFSVKRVLLYTILQYISPSTKKKSTSKRIQNVSFKNTALTLLVNHREPNYSSHIFFLTLYPLNRLCTYTADFTSFI